MAELITEARRAAAPSSIARRRIAIVAILIAIVAILVFANLKTPRRPEDRPGAAVPVSLSESAEAVGAYRAGLQAQRDGSKRAAMDRFARATELDPTFAQAHLRWVLAAGYLNAEAKEHYLSALNRRSSLDDHDRALLLALEPRFRIPADFAESERRLVEAISQHPTDADYLYHLGKFRLYSQDFIGAISAEDAALANDAELTDALRIRGLALSALGRSEEAMKAFSDCADHSARSAWCIFYLSLLYGRDGKCDAYEALTRRLITEEPSNPDWYLALAQALYSRGESREAVEIAIQQSLARTKSHREVDELIDWESLAVFDGDFETAERLVKKHFEMVSSDNMDVEHFLPSRFYANLLTEMGREREVPRVANEYLSRHAGWVLEPHDVDKVIFLYESLYRVKTISRDDLFRARDTWLESELSRPGTEPAYAWVLAYAQMAHTRPDAEEALRTLPRFLPLRGRLASTTYDDSAIGLAYLRAGDPKAAIPYLARTAYTCTVMDAPFGRTWSLEQLGEAYEASGARDEACDAYRAVVQRWGKAKPRSTTAEKARAAMRRIGCARAS